jgi:hypothetical protein
MAKKGSRGGKVSGLANSYWHHPACRVYVYLQQIRPDLVGHDRADEVAKTLNKLRFKKKNGRKIDADAVLEVIKKQSAHGVLDALRRSYADHWDDLPKFSELLVWEAATERDAALPDSSGADHRPDLLAGAAAIAEAIDSCPLPVAYRILIGETISELRSVMRRAELKWDALHLKPGDRERSGFPARGIVAQAFPNVRG